MDITLYDLNLIEMYNETALCWKSHIFVVNIKYINDNNILIFFKEEFKFL